jgi:DNA-binding FadR family transcriptional regulator
MPTEKRGPSAAREGGLLPRRSLHEQVVEEIGLRIVRGDFGETGMLPTEPRLAAELGVSRNVLREAVKVLISKGLIDVRPKSGMRIRPQGDWILLDRQVLNWFDLAGQRLHHSFDLVEFRLIVEPKAAYLAALRATAAEKKAIEDACTALEGCVGHPEWIAERDLVFHHSILAASHNMILNHLGLLVSSLMQIQVLMTTDQPGAFERGLPLHRQMTNAILAAEADRAEQVARRLVQMPYDDLGKRMRLKPKQQLKPKRR